DLRTNAMGAASVGNLHSGGALALEGQPGNQCMGENGEIRSVQIREDVRSEYGLALAIAGSHVRDRGASLSLHHPTVLILEARDPDRARSFKHGKSNRLGVRRGLNKDRSSGSAVLGVWGAMPIFDATIHLQHRLIAPCRVACLRREEVPIALVSPRPSHYVDARAATQHLTHVHGNSASVEMGIRLCVEAPVTLAPEIEGPLAC